MRMNSVIHALFGFAATAGAAAVSLPASAATVTVNNTSGTASQAMSGSAPSITVGGNTVICNIKFDISAMRGAYAPGDILAGVTGATFTAGSPLCNAVREYVGAVPAGSHALSAGNPWPIQLTAITASNQLSVKIQHVVFYTSQLGFCYGDVIGTFDPGNNDLAIPAQSLTHANNSGVVSGTCSIGSGVSLEVSPADMFTM
jgi:hypothetical protein